MFVTVCLVLFLFLMYWKMKRYHQLFKEQGIPGPNPSILVGNASAFKDKSPLQVFKEWTDIYGKCFGFYEGLHASVVVSDPDMIQHILVKQFHKFHERPLSNPFLYYPDQYSLVVTKGHLWREQRHIVSRGFSTLSAKEMLPNMISKSKLLLDKLESTVITDSEDCDISNILERFMLDAFAYSAFDYDCDSMNSDDEILYKFVKQYMHTSSTENPSSGIARLFPALTPLLKMFNGNFAKVHKENIKHVQEFIEKEKYNINMEDSQKKKNLINVLLTTKTTCLDGNNKCKRQLSEEEVLAQVISLVGGGLGPASSLISFLIYNLAAHIDVQDKVVREISSTLNHDKEITYNSLVNLPYLDMVINETLRVFPVAPGVARICTEDTVIDGIPFKAGTNVRIMSCVMYQDQDIFPKPDEFIPERFSKEQCETRHPFTWLPYGHGPRNCVGKRLGLMLCKLACVQILRKYRIVESITTEKPLKTKLDPVLTPRNGVHVKLVPRIERMSTQA